MCSGPTNNVHKAENRDPARSPIHVVHFHKEIRLEQGGVVRAVLDLCDGLGRSGHRVTLVTPDAADVPKEWGATDSFVRVLEAPRITRFLGTYSQSALQCVMNAVPQADVLHLHGVWSPHNVQLAAAARKRNLPYVYSAHGMLDDWSMAQSWFRKRLYLVLLGKRSLERAAAVHFTAEAELAQATQWIPRGRGVVVPLLLNLDGFRTLPGRELAMKRFQALRSGDPVVLFLSRLHYKKGVEMLIEAISRLARSGRFVRALLAGVGDEAYEHNLRTLVSSLALDDRIEFIGFVGGAEKVSLLQAVDVFVLPTSQENFGIALFEALLAGTPLITTRGADTWPELQASGGAQIVVPDPQELADAIAKIVDEAGLSERIGAEGRRWAIDNLDPDTIVRRYEDLYRRAMTSPMTQG